MRLSNRKRDLLLSCQFQSDKAVNFRQNNVLCVAINIVIIIIIIIIVYFAHQMQFAMI